MKNIWTLEKLKTETLKYKSKKDFAKGSPEAYASARKNKYWSLLCEHMLGNVSWDLDKVQIEALKYKTRGEFQSSNGKAYAAAHRMEILDVVCAHMNQIYMEWTFELIQKEALKYHTRADFAKNSAAYHAAIKRGILDDVCSHMSKIFTVWEIESIREEALKYKTRSEFKIFNTKAYQAAQKRSILNDVCRHMDRPTISNPEKTILEEVQKYFPEAKKFRATKLKIPGKEYIKTLEVDILVKSLGKGIEYDSDRFHSLEGLKRGHPTWKMKHLKKYHEIKDEAFESLGIQILHIKEADWKINKQACIEKCIKFLSN